MFDEVVGEFRKMWKPEEYPGFDGKFFSMPARNVLPKPYSAPHPPMWVAAGNPSTFTKAARMGLGVLCFTIGGPESVKPLVELYKNEIGNAEPVGDFVNDNIMVTTQLLCLEDGQRARDSRRRPRAWATTAACCCVTSTRSRARRAFPSGRRCCPTPRPRSSTMSHQGGRQRRTARPTRSRSRSASTPTPVSTRSCSACSRRAMERDLAIETIETFGKHVLPVFDTDPVHRTTRQREAAAARGR